MQISADVFEPDDFRQLAGEGGFDLAAVFPQNGFHAGHAQGFVDVVFGFAGDGFGLGREAGLFFGAVIFFCWARPRSLVLCSFDPVKYWRAAPKFSAGTMRRSTCNPRLVTMQALVWPWPRTRSTKGSFTKAA